MTSDIILLGHGSGGTLSHQLLDELIVPILSGIGPRDQNDAAVLAPVNGRLAFTTDSYVVDPIFFPGGDIGDLAVYGTVNDLAMAGARPLFISVGLILEEGLPVADLKKVLESLRAAADRAGVKIVTGDTKVVPRGKADKLFINTAGIGVLEHDLQISGNGARPGDRVLINGTFGDHGMAVLAAREGLDLTAPIRLRLRAAARTGRMSCSRDSAQRCTCCATRPAAGWPPPSRRLPASRMSTSSSTNRPAGDPGGGRGLRHPRPRPAVCRQRGEAAGLCRS